MSGPRFEALTGIGEVQPGEDIAALIAAIRAPRDGEIVVIAQKIVSKAEGRAVDLGSVEPSPEARAMAAEIDRDPRLVSLVLAESRAVVRADRRALIVETRHGLVCANAGIDASNSGAEGRVLLLPADPDGSARAVRRRFGELCGSAPGVLISDSFGRPWRLGQTEVAIGLAGVVALADWRGRRDRDGRPLAATEIAVADQIAAAAELCRDKAAGLPVVIVSGLANQVSRDDGPGAISLRRPADEDLFGPAPT